MRLAFTPASKPVGRRRPDTLPARILFPSGEAIHELPIQDHPYFLVMPVWGEAGIVDGRPMSIDFPALKSFAYWTVPDTLRSRLNLSDEAEVQVRGTGEINFTTFARAIAKVAYCHAVLKYGLDGFRKLVTAKLILGSYPYVPHFVGAPIEAPKPFDGPTLHLIEVDEIFRERMRLIRVSVRLFANQGPLDGGMPVYHVIVGAPALPKSGAN